MLPNSICLAQWLAFKAKIVVWLTDVLGLLLQFLVGYNRLFETVMQNRVRNLMFHFMAYFAENFKM